jgi:uncharacterized membrane protein
MNLKKIFLAGLATILPLAVTLFIIHFFVDILTTPFIAIFEDLFFRNNAEFFSKHRYLLVFISQVSIIVTFIVLTFVVGVLGQRYIFSLAIKLSERVMKKIPVVKTIYKLTRDVTSNVFSPKKQNLFKERVLVPFPYDKTYALGLMSDKAPSALDGIKKGGNDDFYSVFVPTSPHPISGFLILYSEKEMKKLDITTEDLFKFLISCGMYDPANKSADTPDEEKSN